MTLPFLLFVALPPLDMADCKVRLLVLRDAEVIRIFPSACPVEQSIHSRTGMVFDNTRQVALQITDKLAEQTEIT